MIIAVVIGLWRFLLLTLRLPDPEMALDTPSPALGKAVATAVHQALTDPYFAPLERLAAYLRENPESDSVTLEQLVRWSPDDRLPTCFVWDPKSDHIGFSEPSSPWALEEVVNRLRQGMFKSNPRGLLMVDTFSVEGDRYWLGFLKVPLQSEAPSMLAGVFLNIDDYLAEDAPRQITKLTDRRRFPSFELQRNEPPLHNEPDGDLSFRILNRKGEVYYQHGRMFEPTQMIYSESRYYPNPIVALQEGWDLQVFSCKATPPLDRSKTKLKAGAGLGAALLIIALGYWWGNSGDREKKES